MNSQLIYAASAHDADLLFASGFMAPDPFIWFHTQNTEAIIVSSLEYGRAQKQAKPGVEVINSATLTQKFGAKGKKLNKISECIAFISETFKVTKWEVPENFPLGLAVELQKNFSIEVLPHKDFCPGRQIKNDAEIRCISRALRITEAGLERGLEVLRQSVIASDNVLHWHDEILTAEILRGEIDCEIARRGGTAAETITAPGVQGADPHQCGTGPIHANEPIVMDIFPRDNATGFYGDLTRTVVKGQASDQVQKAFACVKQAQTQVLETLRPGNTGKSYHQMVADFFEKEGFKTELGETPCGFFHGLGHGLGLEIHEKPCLNTRDESLLQPGNVVTVEPGLYYPEWGGIRIENVAVLTDKGCQNLTFSPIFLVI